MSACKTCGGRGKVPYSVRRGVKRVVACADCNGTGTAPAAALKRVERAAAKHAKARAELDVAIREASAAGVSLRPLAEAAGLSREWVRQIAQGKS